ncbi:winged helix-turn-helix domain-containing protein [Streptomyces sp. NBC_00885]|nr:winged helix-turn-helix domain-containing protein [Streptomyces sp. NBC_00885]
MHRSCGCRYTPRGVYLQHRLGWSPQVPATGRSSVTSGRSVTDGARPAVASVNDGHAD